MRRYVVSLALALTGFSVFAGASVTMKQTVNLTNGWSAVYVRVGTTESADALFAEWPVKWVALYDATTFVDTRQFDPMSETEGTTPVGYRVWRRDNPSASTLTNVPANSVLVTFNTNATSYAANLYGTPRAPRIAWHDSLTRGTMNLIGFSTHSDTVADDYFSGLDVGDAPFYVFGGTNPNAPSILPVTEVGLKRFSDGEVLLVDSKKVRDWSGVLNVSPAGGLDFGTELGKSRLEVRNDGQEPREVEMIVRRAEAAPLAGAAPDVPEFHCRDVLSALTNGPWTALTEDVGVRRTLATGETWRVELAVDRTKLTAPAGTVYGAVFEFRDVSESGSHMDAFVPVTVTGNGPDQAAKWSSGLWLVTAALDTVTYMDGEENPDLPAGGTMNVRLPICIDLDSKTRKIKMYLLHRVWLGRDTNGVLKAFAGQVKTAGEPLTDLKRFSTPFVPTDKPVTSFSPSSLTQTALVKFTVGETSRGNPMYHAQHPQHNALTADYSGRTPSGDQIQNYALEVKPETFSITNRIEFAWDKADPAWTPDETLTGTLTWRFDGLRHAEGTATSGELRAKGPFKMERLTSISVKLR